MRDERPRRRRAVSDLMGFAIVFGIVVLSISLVYTFGVGALTEVQRGAGMDNAERAFDILADNLADIHVYGAPGRSTELQFASGQVAVTGEVSMTVTNDSRNLSTVLLATPIRYTSGDTAFYYAGGAVVRRDRDAAVMVTDPPFRFSDERVVISFVETVSTGDSTSVGGGSVRVAARRVGVPTVRANEAGPITFNVSLTSPRYAAWGDYFRRQGCLSVTEDAANSTVICRYRTDHLYVRQTPIRIELAT